MNIKLRVGSRIKDLRKQAGITQEKLAELASIDYKHIQLLEGKKPTAIRIDTLEKLCNALNLSLVDFFDTDIFKK